MESHHERPELRNWPGKIVADRNPADRRLLAGGWERQAVAGDGKSPAKTDLPADLDLVPRHAVGFRPSRAADLWRTDVAKNSVTCGPGRPRGLESLRKKISIESQTLDRIKPSLVVSPKMTEPFPSVDRSDVRTRGGYDQPSHSTDYP